MTHPIKRFLLITSICAPLFSWGINHGEISYSAEGRATLSKGEHTPFWLTNNQYGLSSLRKTNGYLRAGIFADLDTTSRRFKWAAGVDVVAPLRFTSNFIIQQLYADLRYRCLGLTIGSKEFTSDFFDPRLSSGDLLESSNARPIPQIRFGLPHYTTVPGTKGWFAVKAHVAFGRFTDDTWQRDFTSLSGSSHTGSVLYHSKSIFFRVSNLTDRNWEYELGMKMAAQFGGRAISGDNTLNLPHSIKDYFRAIFALSGGSNSPQMDQANVYGNHLGNWITAITYRPTKDWELKAYLQHFFEDHSMMFFDYPWKDNMIGFQITPPRNPVVNKFVYEFIYAKFQSGSVYWDHNSVINSQISGRDNYYNHGVYNAWQHYGMNIGNPLFLSPIYNSDGTITFRHNRIVSHHIGFDGTPSKWLSYRLLFSYTRSWGTYATPTDNIKDNVNTMLELTSPLGRIPGMKASLAIAVDRGNLIGHSAGAMITITKTGIIK